MSHRNPAYCHKQNPGEVTRAQFPLVFCPKQNPGEVTATLLGLAAAVASSPARRPKPAKPAKKGKAAGKKK